MFEEKENRYRLVCMNSKLEEVMNNIKKYNYFEIVGTYEKDMWTNIIIDSEMELNYNFVLRFNKEVNNELATFEDYEQKYD